jgi:hypothetical protein
MLVPVSPAVKAVWRKEKAIARAIDEFYTSPAKTYRNKLFYEVLNRFGLR